MKIIIILSLALLLVLPLFIYAGGGIMRYQSTGTITMKTLTTLLFIVLAYIAILHINTNIKFIYWYNNSSAVYCESVATGYQGKVEYTFDYKAMLVRPYTVCETGTTHFYYQDYQDSF